MLSGSRSPNSVSASIRCRRARLDVARREPSPARPSSRTPRCRRSIRRRARPPGIGRRVRGSRRRVPSRMNAPLRAVRSCTAISGDVSSCSNAVGRYVSTNARASSQRPSMANAAATVVRARVVAMSSGPCSMTALTHRRTPRVVGRCSARCRRGPAPARDASQLSTIDEHRGFRVAQDRHGVLRATHSPEQQRRPCAREAGALLVVGRPRFDRLQEGRGLVGLTDPCVRHRELDARREVARLLPRGTSEAERDAALRCRAVAVATGPQSERLSARR